MKYIVEVRIGKQWTRSSNTAITVSGPVNLISYGFSTMEEAEREATAQQQSVRAIAMGLKYRVSVLLERERMPEMKYIVEVFTSGQWRRSGNAIVDINGEKIGNLSTHNFDYYIEAQKEADYQSKQLGMQYRVIAIPEPPEPFVGEAEEERTVEESIVDDFLTLEGNGDALILEGPAARYTLASNEHFSKHFIRETDINVREVLVSMVYEGRERLRREIADAKKREMDATLRTSGASCNAGPTVGNTRP